MAKLEGNIIGGFRGKLGNLVGYSWKGVWCVRSRPAVVRNPRSAAQQRHRSMFAEEVRLAGRMSWALNIGMAAVANELHITPQNAFVKANQPAFAPAEHNVPSGLTAGLIIDWSALIVSAGPVAPVALGVPQLNDDILSVAFEKNPYHLSSNNYDQVHLYIYCPAMNTGYLAAPVYRKERNIAVALPDYMTGHELHLYAFVTDSLGRASETAYACVPTASLPGRDAQQAEYEHEYDSTLEISPDSTITSQCPGIDPSSTPVQLPEDSDTTTNQLDLFASLLSPAPE